MNRFFRESLRPYSAAQLSSGWPGRVEDSRRNNFGLHRDCLINRIVLFMGWIKPRTFPEQCNPSAGVSPCLIRCECRVKLNKAAAMASGRSVEPLSLSRSS
ncbi:hypothetical protein MHYP_G00096630 [Metynnis hypsauchen]